MEEHGPHQEMRDPSSGVSLTDIYPRAPARSSVSGSPEVRSRPLVDSFASLCPSVFFRRWFEWVTKGKKKIPYFMRYPDPVPATSDADDGGASTSGSSSTAAEPPFIMFAGLWDSVTYEGQYPSPSFPPCTCVEEDGI